MRWRGEGGVCYRLREEGRVCAQILWSLFCKILQLKKKRWQIYRRLLFWWLLACVVHNSKKGWVVKIFVFVKRWGKHFKCKCYKSKMFYVSQKYWPVSLSALFLFEKKQIWFYILFYYYILFFMSFHSIILLWRTLLTLSIWFIYVLF